MTAEPRLVVFAVEDDCVQVCWERLPHGPSRLIAGDTAVELEPGARPGSAVVGGLAAGTEHDLVLERGASRRTVARFRTLDRPPGALLSRFATVSDIHVGERAFGMWPRIHEDLTIPRDESYAVRCLRGALADAAAWGAECVLAKGDLTWSGQAWQWDLLAKAFAASAAPVHAVMGNHDVGRKSVDGRAVLSRLGFDLPSVPTAVDLSGIRIVLAHTAEPGESGGALGPAQRKEVAALLSQSGGPAFLGMHHYVEALPFTTRYPAGLPRRSGNALLRAAASANPNTFVSVGHTHRNRRTERFGLTITEVGSTKDYPGVWAGYAVYEGGIRQVVRRVSEPDCMAWTDGTKRTLAGFWRYWSPGRLSWRCFTHQWQ